MSPRIAAACVHILTASGAVLGLLALMAAHDGAWQAMFVWLGLALVVDAVDGPLARAVKANAVLPRFSGERLDRIVDYLTYVAVPAFVLAEADLLPEPFRLPAAAAILLSSLFHVADTGSKTREGYFVGFPAVWNIVLLYLFALGLTPYAALAVVTGFVALTFVPVLAVHPFRVARTRILTALVTLLWGVAAIAAIANPFPSPLWVRIALVGCAAYFAGLSLHRSLSPREE